MDKLTNHEIQVLNRLNTETINMGFGKKFDEVVDKALLVCSRGTAVNAVSAEVVLAISAAVIHGETVTINNPSVAGVDVYEFLSDESQQKSDETNVAVDISAYTTQAVGTLTLVAQPTSGDTMTIGNKTYTFVPVGTDNANGEISVGSDLTEAQENIVAAVNGTDGFNVPHPAVYISEFDSGTNKCTITAYAGGSAGNNIDTAETFSSESNVFAEDTLLTGTDCSASNAVLALVAAVGEFDTQGVTAKDGDGDTVVFAATVAGSSGNAIQVATTLLNGSFANGVDSLVGGVDATIGSAGKILIDDSYLYCCTKDNSVSDKNWRRISWGQAY